MCYAHDCSDNDTICVTFNQSLAWGSAASRSFNTVGFIISWRTMGFCTVWRINSGFVSSYNSYHIQHGSRQKCNAGQHPFQSDKAGAVGGKFSWCIHIEVRPHHAAPHTAALVPERIEFKLAVMVYRCLHQKALSYSMTNFTICPVLTTVSVSTLPHHHRLVFNTPNFQPSVTELFRFPAVKHYRGTSSHWHHHWLF